MTRTVLHLDSSARTEGSVTRDLSAQIVSRLDADTVIRRDLAAPLPLLDGAWIGANFTPADQRSEADKQLLALSDALVAELKQADTIVIGAPIYNFSVPSTLKAWIDLVARVGVTFRYEETGPIGLLEGKRAIIAVASGGTQAGSDIDFATTYLRHVLGFIGITEVEIVAADAMSIDAEGALAKAKNQIEALAA
ncbi:MULTISPECIES: FMN-dependent NADH-azoreductase [unclassified Leisingera]|uniref:FMN-dependent NADH-azoreductase n=1 Tax=unclassified Leisingera TaxID=2614906 RepID=UPI0002E27218|nr:MULTISPECIES: NAD(P)H-dependent oxidoreductase [unclassified Leisingera]KIC21778.1 FMN-dependent NADH-azoreductase [Leisingera sp. ANG-S3]KIC51528.1 FMN-dependent NADH-azoreductase [Leisingera sp. ANG-S]KID07853.1 FMN-dependent NADH-azoreductase [Leisingera sp. ANG1]